MALRSVLFRVLFHSQKENNEQIVLRSTKNLKRNARLNYVNPSIKEMIIARKKDCNKRGMYNSYHFDL